VLDDDLQRGSFHLSSDRTSSRQEITPRLTVDSHGVEDYNYWSGGKFHRKVKDEKENSLS
jgi:hypothetical protein